MTTALSPEGRIRGAVRGHVEDPLYLHSYLLLASTAATAGSGFVFWVVAARLTDADEVGRATALLSAIMLLTYLTSLGLPYGMLRFGAIRKGFSSMLNAAMLVTVLTSAVASVIFVAGVEVWTPELRSLLDGPAEIVLFCLANIFTGLAVMVDNIFAARRTAQYALVRNVAVAAIKLAALAPLAVYGAMGLYAANVVPLVLIGAIAVVAMPRVVAGYRFTELGRGRPAKALFSFSLQNYPASLLAGGPPFFLPLIVLGVAGPSEAAYFYAAWSLISVLLLLPNVISNMALSEGARERPWATALKARTFALVIVVPITVVLALLAGPVLSLFGPEYAENAAGPLRVFAISLLPWTFLLLAISGLRADLRYGTLTLTTGIFAICSLLGPALLGSMHGLMGVAVGWTLGITVAALATEVLVHPLRSREAPT